MIFETTCISKNILLFVFRNLDFWPFYGLYSCIFLGVFQVFSVCEWSTGHTFWPRKLLFWKYDLYEKDYRTIFGGEGWHMEIWGRILLRPERSSAARRCACLFLFLCTGISNRANMPNNMFLSPKLQLLSPYDPFFQKTAPKKHEKQHFLQKRLFFSFLSSLSTMLNNVSRQL